MNRFPVYLVLFAMFVVAACRGTAPKEAPPTPPASASPSKSLPKIVAFGDSLTAGFGLSESSSYPSLLQNKLTADGFDYEVINAGVSGDTSAGGVRRIDWALEGNVKVVILELGANDILRGQPITEMRKNLGAIIERCKTKGALVLLAGMEAPTETGADYRRDVHGAFASVAREYNVALIPFFLEGVAAVDSLNQRDGIHPNEQGTKIVAENVYKSLRPMLESLRSGGSESESHSMRDWDKTDELFAWLKRAHEDRDISLTFIKVEPRWDNYRADPRLPNLYHRVGFTP
jgi:acyl-CoA thioesterase I